MEPANIYTEHEANEADRILSTLGISRSDAKQIAAYSRLALNQTSPYMPLPAPGTNAYYHGVESMRSILIDRGNWRMDQQSGIESVVNDSTGVQLLYQNVDSACTVRDPQPISQRGPMSRELINSATKDMFNPADDGDLRPKALAYPVWVICVCHLGENVCVEISRPRNFSGKWYEGFHERIFIASAPLDDLIEPTEPASRDTEFTQDTADFPVSVSRKETK